MYIFLLWNYVYTYQYLHNGSYLTEIAYQFILSKGRDVMISFLTLPNVSDLLDSGQFNQTVN